MSYPELEARLREVVDLTHPYPFRSTQAGTPASVLLLTALRKNAGPREIEILITRRGANLETHKSQYALPGGMQDPMDGEDGEPATLIKTALRETEEEMGLSRSVLNPIGILPQIWTPSGFKVTPVLGSLRTPIEEVEIRVNPEEVDLWFWCALSRFQAPGVYTQESRSISVEGRSLTVMVDVFQIDGHRIWGATAAILKNFIGRWEKLG